MLFSSLNYFGFFSSIFSFIHFFLWGHSLCLLGSIPMFSPDFHLPHKPTTSYSFMYIQIQNILIFFHVDIHIQINKPQNSLHKSCSFFINCKTKGKRRGHGCSVPCSMVQEGSQRVKWCKVSLALPYFWSVTSTARPRGSM